MKLLVLDLDETLLHATEIGLDREADFHVAEYAVYKRPGLSDFLETVHGRYRLAVWTSSTKGYAQEVVPNIFTSEIPLDFVWSRERCTIRFDPDQHKHEWAKNLSKLKRLGYRLEDIVMVDDTPKKLEKHYGNLVRVKPFYGDTEDRELPALAEYLLTLADVANVRAVEKRYWRKPGSAKNPGRGC